MLPSLQYLFETRAKKVFNSCCTPTSATASFYRGRIKRFYIRRQVTKLLLLGHVTRVSKHTSPLVLSLADRFFIAMLFSDAPMPFCDIFAGGRPTICPTIRRSSSTLLRPGYRSGNFMPHRLRAAPGIRGRAAVCRPNLPATSRSWATRRRPHILRAPRGRSAP